MRFLSLCSGIRCFIYSLHFLISRGTFFVLQSQRKCEKKTKMEFSLWKHITIIRWRYAAKAMLAKITPRHTSLRPDKSTFAFFIFILTAHKFLKAVNVPVLHKNYDFISILSFLLGAKSIAVCALYSRYFYHCILVPSFLSFSFSFSSPFPFSFGVLLSNAYSWTPVNAGQKSQMKISR